VYFLYLAWPATRDYLNPDDSMNLYFAWSASIASLLKGAFGFWTGAIRPVGGLYYHFVYALGGFNPLPFRATCFLLLILNLVLSYQFYRLVTASLRDSFLAAFFGCFHGSMWNIYASTGTIYDILCQTFVLTALILYVMGRSRGAISWRRAALIWLSQILAIGSKEMAYTLPLIFVCFELVFHPPGSWASVSLWVRRQLRVAGVTGLISIAAWIGRKASHPATDQLYGYQTLLTTENLLHSLREYLYIFSFKTVAFSSAQAVAVVTGALLAAILIRSRVMLFGWLYAMVFVIPLLIVPPRHSGYVLYIPFTGCALYLTGAIRWVCSLVERATQSQASPSSFLRAAPGDVILFLFLLTTMFLHREERRLAVARDFGPGGEDLVRVLSEDISRLYPKLPRNTRILLVNDAFGNEAWQPMFVVQLTYGARSLQITKMRWEAKSGVLPIPSGTYDHVFAYDGEHYREVPANWFHY
jgi:hypothetical protein